MKFVKIPSTNYEMLDCPVTQQKWTEVMGTQPFYFKDKPDHPAETISWDDCQEFIKKVNSKSTKYTYRLPTEDEWEFCCRAGSTADYSFGSDESQLGEYAWFYKNSNNSTQPVKQKKSNKFGLYDMHGNVWEWCQDLYNPAGSDRVIRGGSWDNDAGYLRSGYRGSWRPEVRFSNVGFRILRTLRTSKLDLKEAIDKVQQAFNELKKVIK